MKGGEADVRMRSVAVESGECAVCAGTGWVLAAVEGRKEASPCDCRAPRLRREKLLAAGIPERYRDCTLRGFSDTTLALTRARAAATEFIEAYPAVEAGFCSSDRRDAERRIWPAPSFRSSS